VSPLIDVMRGAAERRSQPMAAPLTHREELIYELGAAINRNQLETVAYVLTLLRSDGHTRIEITERSDLELVAYIVAELADADAGDA
jgi:hypothetical protein